MEVILVSQTFPILSWKRIVIDNKETPYIISDKGIIMDDVKGEFLLVTPDKDNYPAVKLFINGKDVVYKVHRLVCDAFNQNPFDFPEVDHLNRNHWDASKDNLEFVTGHENMRRLQKSREIEKSQLCNYSSGTQHYGNVYTQLQIVQVCMRLTRHEPVSKICKKTKVDVRIIYLIKNNKIWKNISCYFSFDNDGFINDENLDKIIQMVHEGKSNSTILYSIGCPYIQYFSKIIDEIRLSINEKMI